ncbi:MAG TPA: hypothetical protein VGI61_11310 [Parafilimonas sp.]
MKIILFPQNQYNHLLRALHSQLYLLGLQKAFAGIVVFGADADIVAGSFGSFCCAFGMILLKQG